MRSNKRALTLFELLVGLVIVVGVVASIFGALTKYSISDGKRIGVVTKLSYKGWVWKTHEGDLLLGGQGTVTSSHWNFSVTDADVAEKLNKAADEQDLVELVYHQYPCVLPWNGETTYFVTEAKLVHKPVVTPAPASLLDNKK